MSPAAAVAVSPIVIPYLKSAEQLAAGQSIPAGALVIVPALALPMSSIEVLTVRVAK